MPSKRYTCPDCREQFYTFRRRLPNRQDTTDSLTEHCERTGHDVGHANRYGDGATHKGRWQDCAECVEAKANYVARYEDIDTGGDGYIGDGDWG